MSLRNSEHSISVVSVHCVSDELSTSLDMEIAARMPWAIVDLVSGDADVSELVPQRVFCVQRRQERDTSTL